MSLRTPYRHIGEEEVLLHSFLTSALHMSGQLHAPAALPRRKNHWIRQSGPQRPCKRFGELSYPCWEPTLRSSSPSPSQYTKYATPAPFRFNSHSGNWLSGLRGCGVFHGTSWTSLESASTRPQSVPSKSFPIRHSPVTLQSTLYSLRYWQYPKIKHKHSYWILNAASSAYVTRQAQSTATHITNKVTNSDH